MLLEVRPDNEPAVALYRKLGFEPVATRRDYYGPGHHALVLQRSLRVGDAWAVECA
jgi:ribosomal-protein-alanine N-acetyltransferase